MEALTGSEKQIEWAEKIRSAKQAALLSAITDVERIPFADMRESARRIVSGWANETRASAWINHRGEAKDTNRVVTLLWREFGDDPRIDEVAELFGL